MFNCYILKVNGRIYGIFPTWEKAWATKIMLDGMESGDYAVNGHYLENSPF